MRRDTLTRPGRRRTDQVRTATHCIAECRAVQPLQERSNRLRMQPSRPMRQRSAASMSTSRCQTIGTFSSGKRGGSVSGASICRPVSAITTGGLVHFHHFAGSIALCVETVTKPGRESCGSEPWPPQIRRFNELFVDSWMGCFSQDPRKVRQSRQIEARSTRSSAPCLHQRWSRRSSGDALKAAPQQSCPTTR
jgi:hypothetical protein